MDYNPDHNLLNGKLTDGDPALSIPASTDSAEFMNAVVDELLAVQSAGSVAADKAKFDQVKTAILNLFKGTGAEPTKASDSRYGVARRATTAKANEGIDNEDFITSKQLSDKLAAFDQQIGVNQTWQNLNSSRLAGVHYTNTSGRPIMVVVRDNTNSGYFVGLNMEVDGLTVCSTRIEHNTNNANRLEVSAIVPAGAKYRVTSNYGSLVWYELR